jgi:hypothetical protein
MDFQVGWRRKSYNSDLLERWNDYRVSKRAIIVDGTRKEDFDAASGLPVVWDDRTAEHILICSWLKFVAEYSGKQAG